jgi:hypothetical protein
MHRDSKLSDLIQTRDVCERAGIDRATLSRHVALGKLQPVLRVGTGKTAAMLFDRRDVAVYIATIKPRLVVGGRQVLPADKAAS